jgi:hypothetical protein
MTKLPATPQLQNTAETFTHKYRSEKEEKCTPVLHKQLPGVHPTFQLLPRRSHARSASAAPQSCSASTVSVEFQRLAFLPLLSDLQHWPYCRSIPVPLHCCRVRKSHNSKLLLYQWPVALTPAITGVVPGSWCIWWNCWRGGCSM